MRLPGSRYTCKNMLLIAAITAIAGWSLVVADDEQNHNVGIGFVGNLDGGSLVESSTTYSPEEEDGSKNKETHHTVIPTTLSPKEHEEELHWLEKRKQRNLKKQLAADAPLDIHDADWWWVIPTLVGTFTIFMLTSVKLKRLGGPSPRLWLTKFVSSEKVYNSLAHESVAEYRRQRDLEYGHQFFNFLGTALIGVVWGVDANRDGRIVVVTLTTLQLVLFFFVSILDCVLLKKGYVRPVRSINTKLRFAHSIYQVVLFCTDAIGGSFSLSLPVDCFVWAIIHYAYESAACTLEGNNITGLTELAISILVVANLLLSPFAAFGWRLAFGLTCLALSSLSMLCGAVWKLRNLTHEQHESAAVDYTHCHHWETELETVRSLTEILHVDEDKVESHTSSQSHQSNVSHSHKPNSHPNGNGGFTVPLVVDTAAVSVTPTPASVDSCAVVTVDSPESQPSLQLVRNASDEQVHEVNQHAEQNSTPSKTS